MRCLLLLLAATHAYDAPRKKTLFVCSNKWCREKHAALVLGAPLSIATEPVDVQPHACFGRCGEGPNCAAVVGDEVLEFHGVDSVEKISHILKNHLDLPVDQNAAKCLELHRLAEAAHRRKDHDLALRLYSDALATKHGPQRAPVLAGRAGARLQLAKERRRRGINVATKARTAPCVGGRARPVLLRALGAFDSPAATALLANDALPALDATASRVVFELASSDFLARGALADAAAAAAALPAYGLAWRRLGESLELLGQPGEAARFAAAAARVDGGEEDKTKRELAVRALVDRTGTRAFFDKLWGGAPVPAV